MSTKVTVIDKSVCPPHEYQSVKYQEQEAITTRHDFRDKLVTVLVHERVKLFCTKCGNTVEVEVND